MINVEFGFKIKAKNQKSQEICYALATKMGERMPVRYVKKIFSVWNLINLSKSLYIFQKCKKVSYLLNRYLSELQGDSGGPLVVQRRDGSFFLAG